MDVYNLVSFAGIFVLIGFAWILSADKKNMNVRFILWGICLWFVLASLLSASAAATLACLMTACVAGTFFTQDKASILFGD